MFGKGVEMKFRIDQELCISCGLCVEMCPEVFECVDDAYLAKAEAVSAEDEESAISAEQECPVEAISHE